jgi:CRP-like cAMP-binding protein
MSMLSLSLSAALSQTDFAVVREAECRRLLDALRSLEVTVSSRRYERGRTIYGKGEEGGGLYVLTEGAVGLFGAYTAPSGARGDALRLVGPGSSSGIRSSQGV